MVDDNKPKTDKQNGPLRGVDPKVEAKVDRMMMPESNKSQTAPLLPGEKLPDFNKKDPKPEIPSASASITKSPSSTGDNPAEDNPALPESPANKALDDPATAHAVDEIVEEESDRMLAIEDAKAQLLAEGVAEIDRGFFARIKGVFGGLWRNVWARTIILLAVLAAVAAIAVVPSTRYFVLNVFGVRASISLRIIDD
ncbi:MAG TPA: hypothetical protein VFX86_03110, partial [Candidatus Saccharimonadales bacterium]|nr:hypothetical protein [Candidatus Saccharimonadales bacterium]